VLSGEKTADAWQAHDLRRLNFPLTYLIARIGVSSVCPLSRHESPEGKLDPEQARGYWFDNSGLLLKTYLSGLETVWSRFEDFGGFKVARQMNISKDGKLAARISITDIAQAGQTPDGYFVLKGHEWQRAFTAEER
jgi:hypothetical protein